MTSILTRPELGLNNLQLRSRAIANTNAQTFALLKPKIVHIKNIENNLKMKSKCQKNPKLRVGKSISGSG